MSKLFVMLVDDEAVSREYIEHMSFWQDSEFVLCAQAKGGNEALSILSKQRVDIILLDVFMPVKNGVELSREIAERYPNITMIAISGYDDYDYVREILKNGAHDYILKHRLNEAVLLSSLEAVRERMSNPVVDVGLHALRNNIEKWLFSTGINPFADTGGRLAITIANINYTHHDKSETVQTSVVQGILNILQENEQTEYNIIAFFRPPSLFIICTHFLNIVSESKLESIRYANNQRNKENVRMVYNLAISIHDCPLFTDYKAFPSYVEYTLTNLNGESNFIVKNIALTIAQRKMILAALDEKNAEALKIEIEKIYEVISKNDNGAVLLITKELLDIITDAAHEYNVDLSFLQERNNLFEWIQTKNHVQLAQRIYGLYRQLIYQVDNLDKCYSKIVANVLSFIRENYMQPIGLEDAAIYAGLNNSYLSRLFHHETGYTFTDYLNRIRINAAKGYIATGIPIKQAASCSGFQNYKYFISVYKKYEGTTPGEQKK